MKATATILLTAAAFALGWHCGKADLAPAEVAAGLRTVVVRDTVRIVAPPAVRTLVRRDTIVIAPLAATTSDSAEVRLEIASREYSGENYRAYVSGWEARLDSLVLTPPLARITIPTAPAPRRVSFGIQAGVGMTPAGVQPYVGVGIGIRLGK